MLRPLSALGALVVSLAGLSVVAPAAQAAVLGAGDTVISGATTPAGVGESSITALTDGRFLVVWEGVRAVTTGVRQGHKREIFGRYLDAQGAPLGEPTTLVSLGDADDASLDAADPAVTTLANGDVALVLAGDTISDAPGATTDRTNWQIHGAVFTPGATLAALSPTRLSDVGFDAATPANSNPAYDQVTPDVTDDHGQLRVVWSGDTPATGDGLPGIWTLRLPYDALGVVAPRQLDHRLGVGFTSTRPRVAARPDSGTTSDVVVVWEQREGDRHHLVVNHMVDSRSIRLTTKVSDSDLGSPDVAATSSQYLVAYDSTTGGSFERFAMSGDTTSVTGSLSMADSWPVVTAHPTRPGTFVFAWVRRSTTSGPGHHEVMQGTLEAGASSLSDVQQVSSVDSTMATNNAESLRPALAGSASGVVVAAWSRVTVAAGPVVAVRASADPLDLAVGVEVTPASVTPQRDGYHPGTPVTVKVTYRHVTGIDTVPARITLDLPGFTTTSTDLPPGVTASSVSGTFDVTALAPGTNGTITLNGVLTSGADGATVTATARIAATGVTLADPPGNNTSTDSVLIDRPPVLESIVRVGDSPTNAGSVAWTVTYDQPVNGVSIDDFAWEWTSSGTPPFTPTHAVSGSGRVWTYTSSGIPQRFSGNVRLSHRAGTDIVEARAAALPLADGNLPSSPVQVLVDRVGPATAVQPLDADPTNAASPRFVLNYQEPPATAPDITKLVATNATVDRITTTNSPTNFTVHVTPTSDGPITLSALAGSAADALGNPSGASNTASLVSDRTAPTLTFSGPSTPQQGPYDLSVTASEPVTGFTADALDVTLGSAEITGGTGTAADPWIVRVTPSGDGEVVVAAPAGAVSDAAGNTNPRTAHSVLHDVTAPNVTVTSSAPGVTGTSPVPFTLTFTEDVTGLDVSDLDVSGGTATLSGSGATYDVLVSPTGSGVVSVAVPAGVAADAAGHPNTAGAPVSRTYDSDRPGVSITFDQSGPTNASQVTATITFTEDVSGFTLSDVSIVNTTARDLRGSGSVYMVTLTPAVTDGTISLSVAQGVAEDAAGNPNTAGSASLVVDRSAPTVALSSATGSPTNRSTVEVVATFSEPVSGVDADSLSLVNATAATPAATNGGRVWTFELTPQGEGPFSARIAAGVVADAAGNPNQASGQLDWVHDTTATATLSYAGPAVVNAPISLTLALSDPATITEADFALVNGTITSLSGSGTTYTVVFAPTSDGAARIQLPDGAFTDAAGNASTASGRVEVTYDTVRPTVTSMDLPSWPQGPFTVPVTFSEPVTLDAGGITVTNGSVSDLSGSGTDWTFVVSPDAEGIVTVALDEGAARDAAGNLSVGRGPATTTYDTTAPQVTVTSTASGVVTTSPVSVVITFSENVTGFDAADLLADHATVTNLVGAGYRWTADVIPHAEGEFSVTVPAGAATDDAGHPSRAGNTLTWEFDSDRPTLALTTTASPVGNTAEIPVTATFSKPVRDFALDDLRLTNADVTGFTQIDARTWSFTLTAKRDGEVRVEVPEGSAASVGNHLNFAGALSVQVDRAAPELLVSGPASVQDTAVEFEIAASEVVTGFDVADVSVTGSARPTAVALTRIDETHWRARVEGMSRAGEVTLSVRAEAVRDAAGNASLAAEATSRWGSSSTLRRFALMQQPGARSENRVALPVTVLGPEDVSIEVTSSNSRLLPASAVTLTGRGAVRQLTLAGNAKARGRSSVVVRATAGGVTKTLRFTFMVGTKRGERIVGTQRSDVILARQGDDTVLARGGADFVYAGQGTDRIEGGAGRDMLVGPSRDVLVGGRGKDVFVTSKKSRIIDRAKGEKVLKSTRHYQD